MALALREMAHRHAWRIKIFSAILIMVGLVWLARLAPIGQAAQWLQEWIGRFGIWARVVFVLVFILASLLLVPVWQFSAVAGAVFGLAKAMAIVSLASTTAAAAAFLIARYLARDRIARHMARDPKFRAIDEAIGEQGWKIVALVRLSPIVPFGLQNYLFGLTAIRFWPYLVTSWAAMLPGTFMYVYFGDLGIAGLKAAGGETSVSIGHWVLRGAGLVATVAVTVYMTYLARKAVRKRTRIETADDQADTGSASAVSAESSRPLSGWPWGALVSLAAAVAVLALAVISQIQQEAIRDLFEAARWTGN